MKTIDDFDADDLKKKTNDTYEILMREKRLVKQYFNEMKYYLMTSVFNNNTWEENQNYLDIAGRAEKCIYCSPIQIMKKINHGARLFVLEMNNDLNKIVGIGLILNNFVMNKYCVYKNGNYNRFVYRGSAKILREQMTGDELSVMEILDGCCFKGNTHLKRGRGIQLFPVKFLLKYLDEIDILTFIMNMFKRRQ